MSQLQELRKVTFPRSEEIVCYFFHVISVNEILGF